MAFSLLTDAWLPARRASGRTHAMRPCDITDGIEADPVVALDWPRPDFRLAGLEFLIGLLATACPPSDDDDGWNAWWHRPPTPETLQAAFAPLAHAFVLDGDGPRFMQDFEDFDGKHNSAETLLIDAPGVATLEKNTDHFVKRDAVTVLARGAAAMALFTLQSFAPSGGSGMRVGMRGGGPLTTLAVPPWHGKLPLWHLLWANVPVSKIPESDKLPSVFPWLSPTRTSETNRPTAPADSHELQAFWGMPRRIRLKFAQNTTSAPCDLSGVNDSIVLCGWRQRKHGIKYNMWAHPLSPYYRQKPKTPLDPEWLPVHGQPGGIGYRHWVGLLFDDVADAPTRRAAQAVVTFRARRLFQVADNGELVRWGLLAAGYDIYNSMKVRDFVESEMPIIEPGNPRQTKDFVLLVRQLIAAAVEAEALLRHSVGRALFSDGATVTPDAELFATLRSRF